MFCPGIVGRCAAGQPQVGSTGVAETVLMIFPFVLDRQRTMARVAVADTKNGLGLCNRLDKQASYPDLCA